MDGLRWWLVRHIAPRSVRLPDSETGVWIVIREGDVTAVIQAERFRLQLRNSIWRKTYGPGHLAYSAPRGTKGRFVGTVA